MSNNLGKVEGKSEFLYLDILKCIGIIGVVGVHLLMTLELSSVDFFPSSQGIRSNIFALLNYSNLDNSIVTFPLKVTILPFELGWQAVHIFIFVSGFGLYLSYLKKQSRQAKSPSVELPWYQWLQKRLNRILPKYWVVLTIIVIVKIAFVIIDWLGESGQQIFPNRVIILSIQYLMSISLIRGFTQASFYSLAGALWFIPLILGMYLVFPIFIKFINHNHNTHRNFQLFLAITVLVTLVYRFLINIDPCATPIPFQIHDGCVDPWNWNLHKIFSLYVPYGLFIARLPEFVLGMYLAHLHFQGSIRKLLKTSHTRLHYFLFGMGIWSLGNVSSYYKASWPFCDLLIGLGLIILLTAVFYARTYPIPPYLRVGIQGISNISYEMFLLHQFVLFLLSSFVVPVDLGYWNFSVLYLIITVSSAWVLYLSCQDLTIQHFPFVKRLLNLIERQLKQRKSWLTN